MNLPAPLTGPGAQDANQHKALALAADRHAITPAQRDRIEDAMRSQMLPRSIRTPEQAVTILKMGEELGMGMMQSFRSIHVIQGTPTLSASLMLGVVMRHVPSFDYQVLERSATRCHLRGRRSPAHSWIEIEYTMEDARIAGDAQKKGNNYTRIPKDMLFARCAGRLARMIAPDTLSGLYATEEVQSEGWDPDAEPDYIEPLEASAEAAPVDADFVEKEPSLIDRILAEADRDALRQTLIEKGMDAPTKTDATKYLESLAPEDLQAFADSTIPPKQETTG